MKTQAFLKTVFSLFLLLPVFLFSQTTVSGKVTFKNKGVKDVNITLKDTYDGATTDADGKFSFETSETGNHILVFTHPKYSEVEKNIEIGSQPLTVNA